MTQDAARAPHDEPRSKNVETRNTEVETRTTKVEGSDGRRRAAPRLPVRIWQRAVALGREIIAAAGGLLAAVGVLLIGVIFVEALVDRTINVQPLSVPKSLSEDGLTPEVAALGLRDRMNALADRVGRERGFDDRAEMIDPEELPDVAVPSVGLSAQALAAEVRAFFKIQNRSVISGEIVSKDAAYDLALRLNGRLFFRSPKMLPRDRLDDLVAQAARAALGVTQPYIGAVLAFDDHDDASAIALCDRIIAAGGAAPRVRYTHLLRAQALSRMGRLEEAAAEYEALIMRNPGDVAAHVDLGDLRVAQRQQDAAVAEYRAAIASDGSLAFPHLHLAVVYRALGRPDDAVAEARAGVALRPKVPYPHLVLGDALRGAGLDAEAVGEYRTALALGPSQGGVRSRLGEALLASGQVDEGVAQLKSAVARDLGSADACRALIAALGRLGRSAEVPSECDAAAGNMQPVAGGSARVAGPSAEPPKVADPGR